MRLVVFSSDISPSSFISLRVGRSHILATPSTVRDSRWSGERESECVREGGGKEGGKESGRERGKEIEKERSKEIEREGGRQRYQV